MDDEKQVERYLCRCVQSTRLQGTSQNTTHH